MSVLIPTDVGPMHYVDEETGVTRGILRSQTYEHAEEESAVIAERVHRGDLFVDVGAHVGYFSRMALNLGAEVVAFEPDPENYGLLERNCPDAALHPYAVGDVDADVSMTRSTYNSGDHRVSAAPGTFRMERLAPYLHRPPALVKIDTQGWDHRVVAGIGPTEAPLMVEHSPGHIEEIGDDPRIVLDDYYERFDVQVLRFSGDSTDPYAVLHPEYIDLLLLPR